MLMCDYIYHSFKILKILIELSLPENLQQNETNRNSIILYD